MDIQELATISYILSIFEYNLLQHFFLMSIF